jgi:hypothetical protein
MTTQNIQARLLFNGGWATDFGPSAPVTLGQDGVIQVPFLVESENAVYDLDGGPKKIGGTERLNATALNSGATVRGLVDFWAILSSGSPEQHRVVHAGDDLMADSADGSFSSILGSLDARDTNAIPSYAIYDDDLIIMSDVVGEVPLRWPGSGNAAVLGTNTPSCAFGVTHKNRFWMAGDVTKSSRLYYSEPLPNGANGDWNEVEAGFIDIDPDDGDEIRGLVSHKGRLWVFKGPYNGSIHIISGDTPLGGVTAFASSTQPQPFEKDIFVRGVGAAGHNSIFRFRDDIGFIDAKTASIRSLNATDQFGDFREASLSLPINDKFLLDRVNKAVLKSAWAAQDIAHGSVLINLAIDTATDNNTILNMDHRFDPPRWSHWPSVVGQCLATVIDQTRGNRQTPFIGDVDGFVRRTNAINRSIDKTTAINYKATLPYLDFGNPVVMKTFARGSVGIEPRGDYNGTFGWSRDDNAQQTTTFNQGGGDVLAGTTTSRVTAPVAEPDGTNPMQWSTSGAHGFSVGDIIAINGTTTYNGVYTIVAVSSSILYKIAFTRAGGGVGETGAVQTSAISNFFALGTSTLSGARFVDRFFSLEEGGEFRSIQFQVTQNGLNEDIAIHSLYVELELGADSTEN